MNARWICIGLALGTFTARVGAQFAEDSRVLFERAAGGDGIAEQPQPMPVGMRLRNLVFPMIRDRLPIFEADREDTAQGDDDNRRGIDELQIGDMLRRDQAVERRGRSVFALAPTDQAPEEPKR